MELMRIIGVSTPAECREMGELLLAVADAPRDAAWQANIDTAVAKLQTPQERDRAARVAAGRQRVIALSDRLRADGMDHRTLVEAELVRRGDPRSFSEYAEDAGLHAQ